MRNFPAVFVCGLLLSVAIPVRAGPIGRRALVGRPDVHVREIDPWSPPSVGNGDFAFTADASGLQSFEEYYHQNGIPTGTLSFHNRPVVYDRAF